MTAGWHTLHLRKLAYFVALSLAAHLLILYDVPWQILQPPGEAPPLVVRLAPTAPPPSIVPRPQPRVAPKRAAEPAAAPPPLLAPLLAPPAVDTTASAAVPTPAPAPAKDEPAPVPPNVADAPPAAILVPPLARRLPRRGEITYELYLGNDKFNVGRTLQTWAINDDRYRLTSVSETAGLARLFSRQYLEYVSTGRLTEGGLRPEFFGTERRRAGKTETAAAKFDWQAMTVTIDSPQRSVALPHDAQDIVSFMYQLGLMPLAPGRLELPITNGWKLERYELEVGIEERLQTPFGSVRAVPVKQMRRPGQESIELWLAPEYRWLPVRIRFFDRQGEPSGEQLVSEIRVADE